MNKKLNALYGIKWNPFSPDLPTEALLVSPKIESFCWRVENSLVREGGFALISGDPGTGKSVVLRLLAERLARLRDLIVGALTRPSSRVYDFYRELGELFGVAMHPHNRWAGFKTLRERWHAHLQNTLLRPALLIDEAQELHPSVLSELRLLTTTQFDSRTLLTVIFAGDARLTDKLRRDEFLPLGSRIRMRLAMEPHPLARDRRQRHLHERGPQDDAVRPRRWQLPHAHHHGWQSVDGRRRTRAHPAR